MGERTVEEWGRVAVMLPGWRWMAGMLTASALRVADRPHMRGRRVTPASADRLLGHIPDPDDPSTGGAMLALLDSVRPNWCTHPTEGRYLNFAQEWGRDVVFAPTLGRACIAAAEALGRWPGGQS